MSSDRHARLWRIDPLPPASPQAFVPPNRLVLVAAPERPPGADLKPERHCRAQDSREPLTADAYASEQVEHKARGAPTNARMDAHAIGQAVGSPDEYYEQFDADRTEGELFYGADRYGDVPAPIRDASTSFSDPNTFDFTFSEDDLLPTQWSNTHFDYSPSPSYPPEHRHPDTVYSRPESDSKERRITIERAFVLSEPANSGWQPAESSSEASRKEEKRSRRLSSTFPSLRRKAKAQAATTSLADGTGVVRPSTGNTIPPLSSQGRQQLESTRDRLRGRTKGPAPQEDANNEAERPRSRNKSSDSKKQRRSFPWERGQVEPGIQAEVLSQQWPATPLTNAVPLSDRPAIGNRTKAAPVMPTARPQTPKSITGAPASPRKLDAFPTFVKSLKMPARPVSKAKDELSATFRSLESDYERFQTKPAGFKAAAIESSLLPFLRNHVSDRSCRSLFPENLERRCKILARWWAALLKFAEDWDSDKLSYRERFTIVEAISGITQRPEWRCVPDFAPQSEKSAAMNGHAESNLSEEETFLVESVHHNIRIAFVDNLSRQLSFAIGRLSLRDPTGALASVGGLSCAYACFFCPGVAASLIRLWRLPTHAIQKLCESTDLGLDGLAKSKSAFPSCIRDLGFNSMVELKAKLHEKPQVPLGFNPAEWTNPQWLQKWRGQKGDVFFVFLRHYHILLAEFIPEAATEAEAMRAPTLVLVQTQMLAVTRSAIHRTNDARANGSPSNGALAAFDGVMSPDSSALTVPLPPEAARSLTGRRFLAMLKDALRDKTTSLPIKARRVLARGARIALHAAVRQTSLFDHNSCFNLCDFVEELLVLLTVFERTHCKELDESEDPTFWADVFGRMLQSGNTLTAMRVFSLLFSIWPGVSVYEPWKQILCHSLLLRREFFYEHCNHWCPLVRVYFFRLLAWRVARFDGSLTQHDLQTLQVLFHRLLEVWSHYKHIAEDAAERGILAPSTAPCNPVPGRRLLIIRTDPPSTPSLRSFETSPAPSPAQSKRNGTGPNDESYFSATQLFARLSNTLEERKRGSFLQTFSNRLATAPAAQSRDGMVRDDANGFLNGTTDPVMPSSSGSSSSRVSIYEQRPAMSRLMPPADGKKMSTAEAQAKRGQAFFKFSLELVDRRPIPDMQLGPPRLPLAAQTLLQSQAGFLGDVPASKPSSADEALARYAGRALAEWTLTCNETQNFFDRRRREGVTTNRLVETPTLGVEAFKRPG